MSVSSGPSTVRNRPGFQDNGPRARAIRNLREWITDGALPYGQPLPAERELAAQLQINRGTLRSALQHLSDEGFLRSNGGRIRIVTMPAKREASVLADVVAVLTDDEGKVMSAHRQSGWMDYLAQGSLEAIRTAGLHALILNPHRLQDQYLASFSADSPRGAVLMCAGDKPEYFLKVARRLKSSGVHVVLHGDDEAYTQYDRVTCDHEAGAYKLTQWLIARGRKRILNFWPAPAKDYWFKGRQAGYERAMREAGLEPLPTASVPHLAEDAFSGHGFEKAARHLAGYLAEHLTGPGSVDALMLASDGFAPATIAACRLFGKEPGTDILIAGYDNYWADLPERELEPTPPSVTVDKNNLELGSQMVQLVLRRENGDLPAAAQRVLVDPELVVLNKLDI